MHGIYTLLQALKFSLTLHILIYQS